MAEWAAVDQYQASTPQTLPVPIPNQNSAFPPTNQVQLYQTQPPQLWRLRFVQIFGDISAGAGGMTLTLQALISGLVGDPWQTGGPIVSTAPVTISPLESYSFTWSPDIGNSYSGFNSNSGRTANTALPLAFLPGLTDISILGTPTGGFAGTWTLQGGQMEIEIFPPDALSGGTGDQALDQIYLLPVNQ